MLRRSAWRSAVLAVPVAMIGLAGWATVSLAQEKRPDAKPEAKKTVLDIAKGSADHKTFVELVKAAGLDGMLRDPGPYTVFAPTDAAFNKLPKGTLDDWKKPENKDKLKDVLQMHVIRGEHKAADLQKVKGKTLKTANNHDVMIEEKDGTWMYGSAKITGKDMDADNGVVHSIDTVQMGKPAAGAHPHP
jgi:transforming growth factor-beta-induced protein